MFIAAFFAIILNNEASLLLLFSDFMWSRTKQAFAYHYPNYISQNNLVMFQDNENRKHKVNVLISTSLQIILHNIVKTNVQSHIMIMTITNICVQK